MMRERGLVLVSFDGRRTIPSLLKLCWFILIDGCVSVVFRGAVELPPEAEIDA